MPKEIKDFSIRVEVKEILAQHGVKANEEQVDKLVEEVTMWDDFLSIVNYFVKKEVETFAEETKQIPVTPINPEQSLEHLTNFVRK